jgi:hypothetical protein
VSTRAWVLVACCVLFVISLFIMNALAEGRLGR